MLYKILPINVECHVWNNNGDDATNDNTRHRIKNWMKNNKRAQQTKMWRSSTKEEVNEKQVEKAFKNDFFFLTSSFVYLVFVTWRYIHLNIKCHFSKRKMQKKKWKKWKKKNGKQRESDFITLTHTDMIWHDIYIHKLMAQNESKPVVNRGYELHEK